MDVGIVERWQKALWIGVRAGLFGAVLLAVGACGGEDSASSMADEGSGETPPVSAEREGAEDMGMAETGQPPEVSECLDLVQAGEFEQAVSICADAAKAAPQNEEVQDALREARSAAGDAAGAARQGAEGAASEADRMMGGSDEESQP